MTTLTNQTTTQLEDYFDSFRRQVLGIDQTFISPFGEKKIVYADWTASGRLYRPIEEKMLHNFGPFVANTHTETSVMGTTMTRAYHHARSIIKEHVHASSEDVLLTCGTGMTGVINKFQRILGLKVPEMLKDKVEISDAQRPILFISHMEHHSNQTSWLETIAKVVVIPCNEVGLFCLENFKVVLEEYKNAPYKIASITSCSNVTGIKTPYYEVAKLMHQEGGLCFVDFACSAPYIDIDMHPENDPEAYLDAIFMSPHKFLGGPGTSGVLLFNKKLYRNKIPDNPGGGTVTWTNPWGKHKYIDDIEEREDGGTPGFLQVIRISLAMRLKEQMGVVNILQREHELLEIIFNRLNQCDAVSILAGAHTDRLGVVSITIENTYHNLVVKMLNDRFGIQSRGGCSCAGTYGHYLLGIGELESESIITEVEAGTCEIKPGWVRISIHPTTTTAEVEFVCESVIAVAENYSEWKKEYRNIEGNYEHISEASNPMADLSEAWFQF